MEQQTELQQKLMTLWLEQTTEYAVVCLNTEGNIIAPQAASRARSAIQARNWWAGP